MFLENVYQGKNELWRYIVSFLLAFFFAFQIIILPFAILTIISGPDSIKLVQEKNDISVLYSQIGMDPQLGMLIFISLMILCYAIFLIIISKMHKRSIKSFITSRLKVDYKRMLIGFILWLVLSLLLQLSLKLFFPSYNISFLSSGINLFHIIALLVLIILSSLQTILLWGYLIQGIALLFRYKWLSVLVVSLILFLLNSSNMRLIDENKLIFMLSIFIYAIFLGTIVVLDNGIEIVIGIGIGGSINMLLLADYFNKKSNILQSLFNYFNESASLPYFIGSIIIMILFVLFIKRIFKLDSFSSLNAVINKP